MDEKIKSPLIRLEKRSKDAVRPAAAWGIRLGSILAALLLGCVAILLTGNSPFKAYGTMVSGALGSKVYLQSWVKVKENWRDSMAQLRNFGFTDQ